MIRIIFVMIVVVINVVIWIVVVSICVNDCDILFIDSMMNIGILLQERIKFVVNYPYVL